VSHPFADDATGGCRLSAGGVGRERGVDRAGRVFVTGHGDCDATALGNVGGDESMAAGLPPDRSGRWIRKPEESDECVGAGVREVVVCADTEVGASPAETMASPGVDRSSSDRGRPAGVKESVRPTDSRRLAYCGVGSVDPAGDW